MFSLPRLPYEYDALEPYIDELTMHVHHDKHHAAYVNNLNEALKGHDELLHLSIEELMKNLSQIPDDIRTKVKNNGGGHLNHSMYWTMMAPPGDGGGGNPKGALASAIDKAFGNFTDFQEAFTKAAMGRFGSGWAWLTVAGTELRIADTANQDTPLSEGKMPILALDVWEHAYYLKYQNLRAEYIKNWWNVVNWSEVEKRFTAAR